VPARQPARAVRAGPTDRPRRHGDRLPRTRLGRLVAIKLLARLGDQDNARFVTEAHATARCNHENIKDIVLTHPDRDAQLAISRWHFELRRTRRGHVLRAMSNQLTEVDGKMIEAGAEAQVRPGTIVRLAQVMTLRFLGSEPAHDRGAETIQHGADGRMRRLVVDDPEISTGPAPPLRT
jgi:hypothetical protein